MFEEPMDAPLWQLVALAAGTGGSMLAVGSVAGARGRWGSLRGRTVVEAFGQHTHIQEISLFNGKTHYFYESFSRCFPWLC